MSSLGLDYDYNPDLSRAGDFNLFIADPEGVAHQKWGDAKAQGTKFLAYLSWYEIGPSDPYLNSGHRLYREAKERGIKVLAENPTWGSRIMDTANPVWQDLWMELVADAAQKGYEGVYFDTWDGYDSVDHLKPKKRLKLLESNVIIASRVHKEFPQFISMVNRGWPVMRACAEYAKRMLVESVFHSVDGPVDDDESADTVMRIERAIGVGYAVNILDYVPSGDTHIAQGICAKANAIGCGCTVVRKCLTSPEILAFS